MAGPFHHDYDFPYWNHFAANLFSRDMLRKHHITDADINLGYFISIKSVQSLTMACWMMRTVIKKCSTIGKWSSAFTHQSNKSEKQLAGELGIERNPLYCLKTLQIYLLPIQNVTLPMPNDTVFQWITLLSLPPNIFKHKI